MFSGVMSSGTASTRASYRLGSYVSSDEPPDEPPPSSGDGWGLDVLRLLLLPDVDVIQVSLLLLLAPS